MSLNEFREKVYEGAVWCPLELYLFSWLTCINTVLIFTKQQVDKVPARSADIKQYGEFKQCPCQALGSAHAA